jgi:hypothetical protein
MNRRSFFNRIAKAAVIAAMCPALLRDGIRREIPVTVQQATLVPFWMETTRVSRCTDLAYQEAFVRAFFYNESQFELLRADGMRPGEIL